MNLNDRIKAFSALGDSLRQKLDHLTSDEEERARATIALAFHRNGWFSEKEVLHALRQWAQLLNESDLKEWTSNYPNEVEEPKNIGLILAGNIPLVGFHDILCTLISGHRALIKTSSSDHVLIQWMMELLTEVAPDMGDRVEIKEKLLKGFDAVIATGSNNSARYFEQYFGNVPHIIRKNRTSVAVIEGRESEEQMAGLMEDALRYYGLGCRNVTKIYVPESYDLNKIFAASLPFAYVMDNKKYANNYAYHRTLMLMERREVLENEIVLLTPSPSLFSPVSVLHYERYADRDALDSHLKGMEEEIQCVVSEKNVAFGQAQKPGLQDYADGVDTMAFLYDFQAFEASK